MANDEQIGARLTWHSRWPVPLPSPYMVVGLLFFVFTSVAPYSIIPSVINWGFVESCRITILGQEKRENHWWTPRLEMHLMLQTRVVHLLAPFLTKASLCLLCVFFSYIYSAPSSFSFISFLLIIKRDTERDRCLLLRHFNFRQHIFRHLILHQSSGLPSKYLLIVSFHFLAFFVCG